MSWRPKVSAGMFVREIVAFSRQFRHFHADWAPTFERRGPTNVVLVHGLYATAGVLRPLRAFLVERLDATTLSFSHPPGVGLAELADRLALQLEAFRGEAVHLVGHSLGGLALLEHLRRTRGEDDPRVLSATTLAAPLEGSPLHRLAVGDAGSTLAHRQDALGALALRVPLLALLAEDDFLIRGRPRPSFGVTEVLPGVGHNGLLFDRRVHERVAAHIAAHRDLPAGTERSPAKPGK